MGDENQPSKKRAAGRELSRDNPGLDDDDTEEPEMGTFKKASDDVLAKRKIVKVRRQQTSTTPAAPTSNPFAGIRLVPLPLTPQAFPASSPAPAAFPTPSPAPAATLAPSPSPAEAQAVTDQAAVDDSETKDDATTEVESKSAETKEKPEEAITNSSEDKEKQAPIVQPAELDQSENVTANDTAENFPEEKPADDISAEKSDEVTPADDKQVVDEKADENGKTEDSAGASLNSFQQLSNNQNAFTGLAGTGFSGSAFSFGLIQKDGSPSQPSLSPFSFGSLNNGGASLFGATGAGSSIGGKTEGSAFSSKPDVPIETGEENEETVFSAESIMFEFFNGGWKERGKGEVKVNVMKGETQKARLVMRAKGNLRLILNASLYADLKLTKMEKKGVTFACVNTAANDGKDTLSTFALKFKDGSIVEEFSAAVSAHQGKPPAALKTPENSPKASED